MSDCINLKTAFGAKYFVDTEESYFAESGSTTNSCTDPWLFQLRGTRGHICPWGGDLLAVCLNPGRPKIAARVMRESWIDKERSQSGDDGEANGVFHVRDIEAAAQYAKLHHRPRLSDEERQRRSIAAQTRLLKTPFTAAQRSEIGNTTTSSEQRQPSPPRISAR
jgi:hypothetical protein